MYLHWVTTLLWLRPIHTSNCGISQGLMHIIWLHPTTVPVNKSTFRFKKMIVLRLTVLSKNGTTTEKKRNGHAIRKRNGMHKKPKRNVLLTVYTVHNTHEV